MHSRISPIDTSISKAFPQFLSLAEDCLEYEATSGLPCSQQSRAQGSERCRHCHGISFVCTRVVAPHSDCYLPYQWVAHMHLVDM